MAVSREGTEVMLFIWIVGVTEIVIEGDGLNDTRDRFDTKGSDPRRHDHRAMREVLTQRVIQPANLFGLAAGHGDLLKTLAVRARCPL